MGDSSRLNSHWNLKWLLIWWVSAALLFASWLVPETRAVWDAFDTQVFYWLNGSLESGTYWQGFWAVVNWRPFDVIAALLIFLLSFVWVYQLPMQRRLPALAGLSLLLIIILATRISTGLLLYLADFKRTSPSLLLEPVFRLTELVDWIDAKDAHNDSFPGDHGYVVIACIVFFFIQAGKRWGFITLLLLAPFMLPRMVSGAHWATDILIGSVTMVLISMSLLFCTPLYDQGQKIIGWIYNKLFGRILGALCLG